MFMPGVVASRKQAGGVAWDLTNAAFVSGTDYPPGSVAGPGTDIFFNSDGTKFYTTRTTVVYEFDASTPWDIDSLAAVDSYDASAQISSASGLFFSVDGTNMYVVQTGSSPQPRGVCHYTLSTAWDVTSASFESTLSQNGTRGVYIDASGVNLYIGAIFDNDIRRYTMSTAWDLSSASFDDLIDIGGDSNNAYVDPTGLIMFVNNTTTNEIEQWEMSVAFDLSTATDSGISIAVTNGLQDIGLHVREDGLGFHTGQYKDNVDSYWGGSTFSL